MPTERETLAPAKKGHIGQFNPLTFLKVLSWSLLIALTLLALIRPSINYDSWWYHLPFTAHLFDIGDSRVSFPLDEFLINRYVGFPRLWYYFQGVAWKMTGILQSVILPQLILAGLYFFLIFRWFSVPISLLSLGLFASPMLLLHYEGTLLDLPTGLAVALFFFATMRFHQLSQLPLRSERGLAAIVSICAASLAGNIKVQGLIAVFAVGLSVLCLHLITYHRDQTRLRSLVTLVFFCGLTASTSALVNLSRFSNPIYPIKVDIGQRSLFVGVEPPDLGAEPPQYLLYGSKEVSFPGPINFILSVTEFDWTMRGVAPWYNIDSVSGRTPRRGKPSRTGGFGALFVLINVVIMMAHSKHALSHGNRDRIFLPMTVLFICVAAAFLPRAHELRYWLFLPLIVLPANLHFLVGRFGAKLPVYTVASICTIYGLASVALSPKSGIFDLPPLTTEGRLLGIPSEIRQRLVSDGIYCDPQDALLFRYSTAVTGVRGVLSHVQSDCPIQKLDVQ